MANQEYAFSRLGDVEKMKQMFPTDDVLIVRNGVIKRASLLENGARYFVYSQNYILKTSDFSNNPGSPTEENKATSREFMDAYTKGPVLVRINNDIHPATFVKNDDLYAGKIGYVDENGVKSISVTWRS